MDNVENFQKVIFQICNCGFNNDNNPILCLKICVREFVTWKSEAYEKVVKSNQRLDELRTNIAQMQTEKSEMLSVMDGVNLRIFQLEKRWNYLMKLQNYYYLLQSTEWRQQYDWIHRETDGSLSSPMLRYKLCSQRNIRPGGESSGILIKAFFDEHIEPHLDRMRIVTPEKEQLKEVIVNCELYSMSF